MGDDNVESFKERRTSLRVDLESEEVRLGWQDKDEQLRTDTATCVDLSRKGLLFEYRQPFPQGALVEVTFNSGSDAQNTVKGQVCRCTESQTGYRIALQLF
ncbi:PilZ domain-containing protein [Shewanella yunxiaonensis]|uniref:PilZ domain-containing protein n=1 Tax=Shewanella yunxiaonensis TaxID=2829809 RepID=A0ABX7YY83_9GAMM|nr:MULTISPECIES: PilZ domain-containing protein [Shewanella]MDF0534236.1 PilZ domain-containing protein [Shewanella sp. A32]QUN07016.1 PilZ domain-containing protein [Shewanella yunxiaonensis]